MLIQDRKNLFSQEFSAGVEFGQNTRVFNVLVTLPPLNLLISFVTLWDRLATDQQVLPKSVTCLPLSVIQLSIFQMRTSQ